MDLLCWTRSPNKYLVTLWIWCTHKCIGKGSFTARDNQINIAEISVTENEEIWGDVIDPPGEKYWYRWSRTTTSCAHCPNTGHDRDWVSKFIKEATGDISKALSLQWLSTRPIWKEQWPINKNLQAFIYNSQKLERIQMPLNRGMDTENVIHLYNGLLLSY